MTQSSAKISFFGEPELPALALCKRVARTKPFWEVREAIFRPKWYFQANSHFFTEIMIFMEITYFFVKMLFSVQREPQNHWYSLAFSCFATTGPQKCILGWNISILFKSLKITPLLQEIVLFSKKCSQASSVANESPEQIHFMRSAALSFHQNEFSTKYALFQ